MKYPMVISGLLLCAAAAPLALAQQAQGPRGAFNLLQHDGDKDGRLTFEEYSASLQQQFSRIDGNGDGTSTPAERQAARALFRTERQNDRFAALDTDSNGSLSMEEFSARPESGTQPRRVRADRGRGDGPRRMGRDRGQATDTDITYADFSSRRIERFETIDQNNDRVLTQEELHAAANAPRPGQR